MATKNEMNQLKYTDLIGVINKIGREKNINITLYKTIISTHKIYGSEYLIETATKLISDPQKHGFSFPPYLGKIVLINYWALAYNHFKDLNYCKAIEDLANNNKEVKAYANIKLKEIKDKKEVIRLYGKFREWIDETKKVHVGYLSAWMFDGVSIVSKSQAGDICDRILRIEERDSSNLNRLERMKKEFEGVHREVCYGWAAKSGWGEEIPAYKIN